MSTGPATAASQTDAPEGEPPGAAAMSIGSVSSIVPANNRKRRRNVSVEVDKAGVNESSDDDDNGGDDALLDWRAKTF